jgi:hypothetical protein
MTAFVGAHRGWGVTIGLLSSVPVEMCEESELSELSRYDAMDSLCKGVGMFLKSRGDQVALSRPSAACSTSFEICCFRSLFEVWRPQRRGVAPISSLFHEDDQDDQDDQINS